MLVKPGIRPRSSGKTPFVDVREEVNNIFDGEFGINGFSFTIILRHIDKSQKNQGFDPLKGEALLDQSLSANNLIWPTKDRFVRVVKKKILGRFITDMAGLVKEDIGIFYMKYDEAVLPQDIIIEIPVDDEGNPASPVKHLKKFQIQDVERVHGNDGRVEYLNIYSERME